MDREIQQRLQWVKMYEECGDAGPVCRRCGISRLWSSKTGHGFMRKPELSFLFIWC